MKQVLTNPFLKLLLYSFFIVSLGSACSSSSTQNEVAAQSLLVSDLKTLPSLDLSNVDLSSSSASLSPLPLLSESTIGETSSAGCEAVNFFKPMILSRLKAAEVLKCYVRKTQEATASDSDTSNDLSIPSNSFAYYQIALIEEGESSDIRVRLGNFSSGSSTTFKMDVCEEEEDQAFRRSMEFQIAANVAQKSWTGYVIDHVVEDEESDFSKNSFTFVMDSDSEMEQDFSFDRVASVNATSYSADNANENAPDSDTEYEGIYRLTFDYTAANERNEITGAYQNSSQGNSGAMYTLFNTTQGAAQMTRSSPGFSFEGSEAYDLRTDPPVIIDSSTVSFFDTVDISELPELVTVIEIANQTAFSSTWDCEAETNSNIVEIDTSGSNFDYSECEALAEEADSMGQADSSICYSQQN